MFLIPYLKFIKFFGGRKSSCEKGKENHCCREEYNVQKRERGSNIILLIILRLLGKREGDGKFGEENQN